MTDKTISLGRTLDLTYYVTNDKNNVSNSNELEFVKGEPSNSELQYKEGVFWTPEKTGEYEIKVGNQELSIKVVDVPDSDIFQNSLYRFSYHNVSQPDGTTPFDVPEVLAGLNDAQAQNSPTFREDQRGVRAGEYDRNDNDYHTFSPDANMPSGTDDFSIAALVYVNNSSDESGIVGWGGNSGSDEFVFRINDDGVEFGSRVSSEGFAGGGNVPSGEWITCGGLFDGDNVKSILNGSLVASDSASFSTNIGDYAEIGRTHDDSGREIDGFIGDIIICDGSESESSFDEYHNEWMELID